MQCVEGDRLVCPSVQVPSSPTCIKGSRSLSLKRSFVCCYETKSHFKAQAGLELATASAMLGLNVSFEGLGEMTSSGIA